MPEWERDEGEGRVVHDEVHKTLNQLTMSTQKEIFIICIHKIHMHYPVIADRLSKWERVGKGAEGREGLFMIRSTRLSHS